MAKVNLTSLLDSLVGRLSGSVFQQSLSGLQLRSLPLPRNPRSSFQQQQRQQFRYYVALWRALTDAQRSSWNDNAPPGTSGFNNFASSQLVLNSSALPEQLEYSAAAPPTPLALAITTIGNSGMTVAAPSAPAIVPTGSSLTFYCSAVHPPSINNPPTNAYSPIKTFPAGTDVGSLQSIFLEYTSRYGPIPDTGRLCWFSRSVANINGLTQDTPIACETYSAM